MIIPDSLWDVVFAKAEAVYKSHTKNRPHRESFIDGYGFAVADILNSIQFSTDSVVIQNSVMFALEKLYPVMKGQPAPSPAPCLSGETAPAGGAAGPSGPLQGTVFPPARAAHLESKKHLFEPTATKAAEIVNPNQRFSDGILEGKK